MNYRTLLTVALLAATTHAADVPRLEGRWTSGRLSTIQYRDAYTGVGAPVSGNYFAYEFRADGSYSFTGMVQNTLYNCTTTLFGEESGTYEQKGDEVALHPKKNPFRLTNTCSPSSRREGPGKLTERTVRVAINGDKLAVTNPADQAVSTFQRERPTK